MTLMACGDYTHGKDADGNPVCVVHAGLAGHDADARTVAPEPDLTGRKSACSSCGRVANSDGTAADGTRVWNGPVPFLTVRADYDESAGRLDSHYCGCRGWD